MTGRKNETEGPGPLLKGKLTFEDHLFIARALKLINNKLSINDYDFKNKKDAMKSPVYKVNTLKGPVSTLKDLMEQILFMDYPDRASTNIYYGSFKQHPYTENK